MKRIKSLMNKWRETVKISLTNPTNFNEIWSVSTSRIQFFSLLTLIILITTVCLSILIAKTTLKNYFIPGGSEVPREELVEQKLQIDKLTSKLNAQEKYIDNIRSIILGKTPSDTLKKIKNKVEVDPNSINSDLTEEEKKIAEKVKNDQRTNTTKRPLLTMHFITPIKGNVIQKFNPISSTAITIESSENRTILSCLSGTIIYSGFSQKDGNILIIEHPNNFISVYKHTKSRLKKTGDKVRTGDPIAITGIKNTSSKQASITFELWLNQKPVNPQEYIDFN